MAQAVLPVSLVIATRDRPTLLEDTVRSVLGGTTVPAELVIADQSTGGHVDLGELASESGCTVRHLRLTSVGLSRAQNQAISTARHQIIVTTHDDVLVESDWLERLVATLAAAPARSIVTGVVRPERPDDATSFTPSVSSEVDRDRTGILRIVEGRVNADPLFPQNLALHRDAFVEVGLFDERLGPGTRFRAAEDNDLGRRLLEAGYRVVVTGDAVVVHRAWRKRSDLVELGWAYGVGQGAFFAKHLPAMPRYVSARFAGEVTWRARRSVRVFILPPRQPRQVLADVAYTAGLVAGLVGWMLHFGRSARGLEPRLGESGETSAHVPTG